MFAQIMQLIFRFHLTGIQTVFVPALEYYAPAFCEEECSENIGLGNSLSTK